MQRGPPGLILVLGLLIWFASSAFAGRQADFIVESNRSVMRCTTAPAGGKARSFALELNFETTTKRPPKSAATVAELRRSIEVPQRETTRPFATGSWRVIDAGGRNDGIFDTASLARCARGCALHEAWSIDTTQTVLLIAKPDRRPLNIDWGLEAINKNYPGTPFAIVAWVGYAGDYFVLRNASDGPSPEKGSCKFQRIN
jgi:hypothetical protein